MGLYTGIALVSCAALVYEVALTRVFAIAQGYHFGFLAISLALLGFGASGTLLAIAPRWVRGAKAYTSLIAVAFSITLFSSYLAANYLPFDSYRIATDPTQFALLAAYLLALVVPFFIAGFLQGLPLVLWPDKTNSLYSANLIGSGLGCVFALKALDAWGESSTVLFAGALAGGAALSYSQQAPTSQGGSPLIAWTTRWLSITLIVLFASALSQSPPWLEVRLSPYKTLSQILTYPGTRLIDRKWNSFSRVDVVEGVGVRSAPGLSLGYSGELPRQTGLVVDADQTFVLTSMEGLTPEFLNALPISLPFYLRENAKALVLEPGGGQDVMVALNRGAKSITAVEQNPILVELMRGPSSARAGYVYDHPNVTVVISGGRDFVARDNERYDVIDLALSENFRPVSAGAFSLGENYGMTVEGFRAYLERLAPNGLLVVQRWLQLPPSEELRTASLLIAGLDAERVTDPRQYIVAIRSFSTMLVMARREPFQPDEIDRIKSFAYTRGFDLVYYPGIQSIEANRFNVMRPDLYFNSFQSVLSGPDRFYGRYEYDIAPPTDDHPFFYQFFKWEQTPAVLALLGKRWQPFGGSGFLILGILLGLVLLLSSGLIALQMAIAQRTRSNSFGSGWKRVIIFFSAIGLGFLFVEVPLTQRFILLLDNPVYSFAIVLFSLLVFSGIGSLFSERVPLRQAFVALIVVIVIGQLCLPAFSEFLLGLTLEQRMVLTILALAPVGFLLGIPFPRGLRLLTEGSPSLLPLAWAVNGLTSVVSSILATSIAVSSGFAPVLLGGGLVYAIGLVSVLGISETGTRQRLDPPLVEATGS